MNIYRLSPTILTLNAWNLNVNWNNKIESGLHGHYAIFYHVPTENFLVCFKGGFGSLLWFPESNESDFVYGLSERNLLYLQNYAKTEIESATDYEAGRKRGYFSGRTIFNYDWDFWGKCKESSIILEVNICKKAVEILSRFD